MVWFVNLLAAFLTLLAIALLRRRLHDDPEALDAPEHRHRRRGRGAAAGHRLGGRDRRRRRCPAILLFALVFYWTPPHFWALSLRIRKDYAAAGVPMLPVVRGIPETTRQIGLYTILLVAISLVLLVGRPDGRDLPRRGGRPRRDLPVAGLSACGGGARRRRRSTAGAIRLYKYSITYLSLLFLAVAIDALVVIPV